MAFASAQVIGFFFVSKIWITGPLRLLFFQKVLFERVHPDTLFHSAIAGMFRTYGSFSTGIDGIPTIPYHFGSHWWVGGTADLMNLSVLSTYELAVPLLFWPFFLRALLHLVPQYASLRDKAKEVPGALFWCVLIIALVGFLPKDLNRFIEITNQLDSESFLLSIILLLSFLSVLLHGWGENGFLNRGRAWERPVVLVILPVLLTLITFSKISTGSILAALCAYFYVRLALFRSRAWTLSYVAGAALFACTFFLVLGVPAADIVSPPHLLLPRLPQPDSVITTARRIFWLSAFVILRNLPRKTWVELKSEGRTGKTLDLEAVVVFAGVAFIPLVLLNPAAGAGGDHFFILAQAVVCFAAALGLTLPHLSFGAQHLKRWWKGGPITATVAIVFVLIVAHGGVANLISGVARANRMRLNENARVAEQWNHTLERPSNLAQLLLNLRSLPREEKRRSAVFVSQDNTQFWEPLSKNRKKCFQAPMVIPALTEIMMIDGVREGCWADEGTYGYGHFSKRLRPQTAQDRTPEVLCRRAQSSGVDNVILVGTDRSQKLNYEIIKCAELSRARTQRPLGPRSFAHAGFQRTPDTEENPARS